MLTSPLAVVSGAQRMWNVSGSNLDPISHPPTLHLSILTHQLRACVCVCVCVMMMMMMGGGGGGRGNSRTAWQNHVWTSLVYRFTVKGPPDLPYTHPPRPPKSCSALCVPVLPVPSPHQRQGRHVGHWALWGPCLRGGVHCELDGTFRQTAGCGQNKHRSPAGISPGGGWEWVTAHSWRHTAREGGAVSGWEWKRERLF